MGKQAPVLPFCRISRAVVSLGFCLVLLEGVLLLPLFLFIFYFYFSVFVCPPVRARGTDLGRVGKKRAGDGDKRGVGGRGERVRRRGNGQRGIERGRTRAEEES